MSFELRKGMCLLFSWSAAITSPSAESDLLMCCASAIPWPETSLFLTRSEPARSTRWSLPCVVWPVPEWRPLTVTLKIECEREDVAFILVAETERRAPPLASASSTSSMHSTEATVSPGTSTGTPGSERTSSPPFLAFGFAFGLLVAGASRSRRFSL